MTEAIDETGYHAGSRLHAEAPARPDLRAGERRDGGRGREIRFAIGRCPLGEILVAATNKGICAILLGEDPQLLMHDLQNRFPKARLTGADAAFEVTVAQVAGLIDAPRQTVNLPLDIRGTAFQQQVWDALRCIPAGRTATYADIAAAVGRPTAIRAVAQACASNSLALAIPCHRVVRSDGSLSGYRWGVERKRELLAREREAGNRGSA